MKMTKASPADLDMAMELTGALDDLTRRWGATVPDKIAKTQAGEAESFDRDDVEQCRRVLGYLLDLSGRASLMRVVFGCAVMLDPRNKCVNPDIDFIDHHPDVLAALAAKSAQPLGEWREQTGPVLWWQFPTVGHPWYGRPTDSDWPGHHTHWTPLVVPSEPTLTLEAQAA